MIISYRDKFFKALLFFFIFLFTLIFLELISYISLSEKEKELKASQLLTVQQNDLVEGRGQRDGCSFSETTIGHPMLGFVHVQKEFLSKSCLDFYQVNNIGMQTSRDLPFNKNLEDFSVMIVGGSVAYLFNDYVYKSDNPYIEDYMNTHYYPPNNKKKFKFYTGAAGAWAMPNQVNMILMYGERIDAAVSIDGYNETFPVQEGKRFETIPAAQFILANSSKASFRFMYMDGLWAYRRLVANSFLKHSYFFNTLYKVGVGILQSIVISPRMIKEFSEGNSEKLPLPHYEAQEWAAQSLKRYMIRFHQIGKMENIKTAEFLQPTRLYGKVLTPEEATHIEFIELSAFQKISNIYSDLKKENYPVRDLTDIFKDYKERIYSDNIHYLRESDGYSLGNDILAKNIAKNLEVLWNLKKKNSN